MRRFPSYVKNRRAHDFIANALREVFWNHDVRARQIKAFERIQNALKGMDPYACAAAHIATELGFGAQDTKDA